LAMVSAEARGRLRQGDDGLTMSIPLVSLVE
jgi:hypothetical protein